MNITRWLNKILKYEDGATSVEYCIMASLIAAVIVGAVMALGIAVNNLFVFLNW